MTTAIDYKYGSDMIEEAKRLGLELKVISLNWQLYEGEALKHTAVETQDIQRYLEGYKEGLMERVELIGLTLDYSNEQWVIKRDEMPIYIMEPIMKNLDVYLTAYHSALWYQKEKCPCYRDRLMGGYAWVERGSAVGISGRERKAPRQEGKRSVSIGLSQWAQ